jgi:hypothetical protein
VSRVEWTLIDGAPDADRTDLSVTATEKMSTGCAGFVSSAQLCALGTTYHYRQCPTPDIVVTDWVISYQV